MFRQDTPERPCSGGTDFIRSLTGADQPPTYWKAQPSLPHGIALGTRQYERLGFDYYCGLLQWLRSLLSFVRVMTRMLATALALAVVLTLHVLG
jgi:hypothetical protein